eukprot:scaffold830_cov112-Isochrysis_galbana.AAC.11
MRHLCVCPCGLLPLLVAARPPRVVSYTGSFFAGAFDALPDPHPGAPLASSSSFSRYSSPSCYRRFSLRADCALCRLRASNRAARGRKIIPVVSSLQCCRRGHAQHLLSVAKTTSVGSSRSWRGAIVTPSRARGVVFFFLGRKEEVPALPQRAQTWRRLPGFRGGSEHLPRALRGKGARRRGGAGQWTPQPASSVTAPACHPACCCCSRLPPPYI